MHFSETLPKLAARSDKFSILRAINAGTSDHSPGMIHAVQTGGKTISEKIGDRAANGGVPYVMLNPGSTWDLLTTFQINRSFSPIWSGEKFSKPQMSQRPDMDERKQLLESLDTVEIHSPVADKMQRFRHTAFDLMNGGGKFFEALELPEEDREI